MEPNKRIPKIRLWASYVLQGLVVLMFIMGAVNNLLQTEMAVAGAVEMGYPETAVFYLGTVLLFSTILYAIPKTSLIGAILLTAWLGGAVATHLIHKDPAFNILFPVLFGIPLWLGVWLRNEKLRQMI